jgi:citrate synthase
VTTPGRVEAATTSASESPTTIRIAGRDIRDLIGTTSLTEAMLLAIDGSEPDAARTRVIDGVLVSLMDHGITPSSLATRLVLDGAPESIGGAVAAGLLATGSRFLGTIEDSAALLQRIVAGSGAAGMIGRAADAEVILVLDAGARVPGLGHNLHGDKDPRVDVLIDLARSEKLDGPHVSAFELLPAVVERRLGRRLVPNAAGAIGAILMDLGYQPEDTRGFALVARCAGLFSHVLDERRKPLAREVWQSLNRREASS